MKTSTDLEAPDIGFDQPSTAGQPWYCGELLPASEVEVTPDLVMTDQFPWSFSTYELLRMHAEVLGVLIDANIFSKGIQAGQLSVRDLAEAGVLRRLVELAQASGVDLRELPGNDWGSTPEEKMRSPRAQRLVKLIREAGRKWSDEARLHERTPLNAEVV